MEDTYLNNTLSRMLNEFSQPICLECLGRQFGALGTNLTNTERAKSILNSILMDIHYNFTHKKESLTIEQQENHIKLLNLIGNRINYSPASMTLKKIKPLLSDANLNITKEISNIDFICGLCNNIFDKIPKIIEDIIESTRDYEFDNFLMGAVIDPKIQNKEDELRARLNISTGESLKKNLNRLIGIQLSELIDKNVEFDKPDLNLEIKVNPDNFKVIVRSNPLCVQGRYHKYLRGIPQTHWPHRDCKGKGCKVCKFTGKQYPNSVEEYITPYIQKYALGNGSKFHGAGREDIDAKCLGTGRPFIIEIKEPHARDLPLKKIEEEIKENIGEKVDAVELEIVPRSNIKSIKSSGEKTEKSYLAIAESEIAINKEDFLERFVKVKEVLLSAPILQRTPHRVAHRRSDLTRKRTIYSISAEWIDPTHFKFRITAMGGTYIKELISSDLHRTNPSISGLFEIPMVCIELDVLDVNKLD